MSDNKITDKDYLYLSAMLRAREAGMLTRETMERMIDAPSFDEAAKLLTDCGFQDLSGMSAGQVEAALSARRGEIYAELEAIVPEKQIIDVFRIRFDYHNAKVMVKSEGADVDGAYLLSGSGRIPPERLIEAYNSEELGGLPYAFRTAIMDAKSVLNRTENPQLADFILDRAYFAEMAQAAGSVSSPFLRAYVGALADSANINAAVRTRRMGRDAEFLRRALVPGGSRGEETILQAYASGEGLASVFSGTVFETAAEKGDLAASGGSLTEFELASDNAVTRFLAGARYVGFGAETVVAYLAAVESEITAARMILTGKLSGVKPEKLRERLRESYA